MIKRHSKNNVNASDLRVSEDYLSVRIPLEWPQSYSNDSAYSADDEDSDMETVNRLQAAGLPKNRSAYIAANNVLHSPLSNLISTSYSSSDSSPSTNIKSSCSNSSHATASLKKSCNRRLRKHEVTKNKFANLKKLTRLPSKRSNLLKASSSRHKKSIQKNVKLLPREQVINSLVLRVSAIKLSSETVRSYQRLDSNRIDDSEDDKQKYSNKIMKNRYRQRLKSKSVLQLR